MKTISLSAIEQDVFKLANEQYDLLLETISSGEYQALEHGEVELLIQKEGTELLRRLFQGHLDLRAANEAQHQSLIGSDQYSRSHHRQDTQRQLETLFGEVVVTRVGYSTKAAGVSALYPADGILNLGTDRYSDGVSRRVAIEASKVSFSETVTTIAETTGAQVGKRQCEEITVKVAQDFSDFYAQRTQESPETTADLLVLTTDGKGIVMHQKDLREATAKAAERAAQKSKVRLSPGQKRQRKRMATVASVYSTPRFERRAEQIIGEDIEKPERPAIRNKRVWASVREEAKQVIDSVFEEATRRDPQHQREWVVLVDGEPRQLESIRTAAKKRKVSVTIVLDFIHVLEYLWKAAHCFFTPGAKEAEPWVMERALRLLQGKVSDVAAGIRRSATLQKLSPSARENVDKCADYLLKYRKYLLYDQFLHKGYPIASGVIEGACRHLVNDRMDITGARWRLDRAEAVLEIRALRSSGDFDEYWKFHKLKEFSRNHADKFLTPEILIPA
ncbi:MAG: ISKra4 family transposase [Pleurocapsa sp. MO_192.B19]|nr:ISKra4 family transposase [Pleurocapsa sp. MO_192.B19]